MVGGTGRVVSCCVIVSLGVEGCAVFFFRSRLSSVKSQFTDEAADWLASGGAGLTLTLARRRMRLHGRQGSGSHGRVAVPGVSLALAVCPCHTKRPLWSVTDS